MVQHHPYSVIEFQISQKLWKKSNLVFPSSFQRIGRGKTQYYSGVPLDKPCILIRKSLEITIQHTCEMPHLSSSPVALCY